ncbi:MAG: MFS transporter, partial [Pseudomonadota bacterium]
MDATATAYISRRPAAAFVGMGLCWGAYAAYVPEIKAAAGVGDAVFGTILSISAMGLFTAMWLAPWLDKKFGRRGMAWGTVLLGICFLLPGVSSSPLTLALAMLAVALASGILDIVMNARVSELEARYNRSMMNFNHAMFSFAYAAGALIAGVGRGLHAPAIAVFLILLIILLGMSFVMRMPRVPGRKSGEARPRLPLNVIIPGGLIVMVAFSVEGATEAWSALHIERTLGGAPTEGALGPAMLGLTMGIGRYGGQILSSRMPDRLLLVLASLMASVGALMAAWASVPWIAYAGFATLGLGISV